MSVEIVAPYLSEKWLEARRSRDLCSSRFAEAIGLGVGKPIDMAKEWAIKPPMNGSAVNGYNNTTMAGVNMEDSIREAYKRTSGYNVVECGIFVTKTFPCLGTTPDGKVLDEEGKIIGVCEFKYHPHLSYTGHIPHAHMVQMMAHMAICKVDWCDYVAVYERDREVLATRVHFNRKLWAAILQRIYKFCVCVKNIKNSGHLDHKLFVDVDPLKKLCDNDVETHDVAMSYDAIKYLTR